MLIIFNVQGLELKNIKHQFCVTRCIFLQKHSNLHGYL